MQFLKHFPRWVEARKLQKTVLAERVIKISSSVTNVTYKRVSSWHSIHVLLLFLKFIIFCSFCWHVFYFISTIFFFKENKSTVAITREKNQILRGFTMQTNEKFRKISADNFHLLSRKKWNLRLPVALKIG